MTIAALMLSGLSSYDRARVCCETWLKDFDWYQIHSFAPDPLGTLPITEVGDREGPRSCFLKRIMGLAMARIAADFNHGGTQWFFCCSDDNWVWRESLEKALWIHSWDKDDPEKWNPKRPIFVGGHTNELCIADGTLVRYPSGGAGYALNRAALNLIVLNMPIIHHEWMKRSNNDDVEDAFIGWACEKLGIPYCETPGFFGCNPGRPSIGVAERRCERQCVAIENPISFHYITAEQMRLFHAEQITPGTALESPVSAPADSVNS